MDQPHPDIRQPCYVDVLLPLPVPGLFTYAAGEQYLEKIKPGIRVVVPFGKKNTYTALVIKTHSSPPRNYDVKEIISIPDEKPVVFDSQLVLWQWISQYYMCTKGEVYKAALPVGLKLKSRAVKNTPNHEVSTPLSALNAPQQQAFRSIKNAFKQTDVVLLHGVTSSGKTEIYIHLIKEEIAKGRQVLYLLPEIALTTQIIARLKAVFGPQIAVYHSRFTNVQRGRIWNRMLKDNPDDDQQIRIILGVRSAIFLPFRDPGLIIVDEEHENTYKQFDPAPRYHARDTAIMLAKLHGAKVLLGTATPSLESYYNCKTGKYQLVELNERYLNLELPEITVVNISVLCKRKQMHAHFSPQLIEGIEKALQNKEQVILFQNRRGFSLYLECNNCGHVPHCKNCDVSLTYHKKINRLRCHYCGSNSPVPLRCTECDNGDLQLRGFGTELIEEEISLFFPDARIERLDLDAAHSRRSYEELIARFEQKESDILVGTQMVSKGLDFDNVSLVGIMNADSMLNYPDFRAHERSFQLMAQVSGRAGRKNKRGQVIIQTSDHLHPVIQKVTDHNFTSLYNDQLLERRNFKYPPFYRLVDISVRHRQVELTNRTAEYLATVLKKLEHITVMGPEYPLVSRVRRLYIKRILVKIANSGNLSTVKTQLYECIQNTIRDPAFKPVQIVINVDPY